MEPSETSIQGVVVRPLRRYDDARGWLMEFYRDDTSPEEFRPAMGYLSVTKPGVARGPHEHRDQTDGFAFLSGTYELFLWENRPGLPEVSVRLVVGEANPTFVVVPPGVVHAYRNVGEAEAFVLNIPNRLYAGWERREAVDEIRHEESSDARFRLPDLA